MDGDFVYSFTITAVVSNSSPGPEGDARFHQLVRDVLRENAPAHVVVEICFLRPARMRRFEGLYRAWQSALRRRQPRPIVRTSTRLRNFLWRCATRLDGQR
jgi:hypothetical protein